MIGTPRVHHRLTDSTNERAKELADAGVLHGTLVTADEQSAGRGRQGRVWTAPPRSAVLMSLVLRELDELLPLSAAVASDGGLHAIYRTPGRDLVYVSPAGSRVVAPEVGEAMMVFDSSQHAHVVFTTTDGGLRYERL